MLLLALGYCQRRAIANNVVKNSPGAPAAPLSGEHPPTLKFIFCELPSPYGSRLRRMESTGAGEFGGNLGNVAALRFDHDLLSISAFTQRKRGREAGAGHGAFNAAGA